MKKAKLLLSLFLIFLFFTACDPSENNGSGPNDDAFAENFGSAVSRDFIGRVVDINNQAVQNATVTIGTSTIQTDVNGMFIINGASVHQNFAYIKATKAGYIDGSRAMVPTSGKNNVKIMLIPNTAVGSVQSGVESEVVLPSGTKVNFDGAFQDEIGNPYSGTVSVAMFHLLPSDENLSSLMPGMLYAQTKNNKEAVLATFGMLNVELRGSAGQKLNIAEGHTAEIKMEIDDSQAAIAPNSIPLWHFDEAKGYWKEDGTATKVGNSYVGEVSHFSWWNCDIPNASVLLTINVTTNGQPLPFASVFITNANNEFASGATDNNGQLIGLVPQNEALTLTISDYTCSSGIVYNATIGPFTADSVLPTIELGISTGQFSVVQGNLVKCDGSPVTNGYIRLQGSPNYAYALVTNGSFSFFEPYCPNNTQFNLEGIDFDEAKRTNTVNYNFGPQTVDVGNIQACNAVSEYILYKIDNNVPRLLSDLPEGGSQFSYPFFARAYEPGAAFSIYGNTTVPGNYSTNEFAIYGTGFTISSDTVNTIQFHLTQYGAIGQYIEMTFDGTYTDVDNIIHTISGKVHIIRDN